MAEPNTPFPLTASRSEQIFPISTPAQIARVAKHGRTRTVRSGEVMVEQGDTAVPFFVVISGELEAVRPRGATETLLLIVKAGQSPSVLTSSSRIPRTIEVPVMALGEETLSRVPELLSCGDGSDRDLWYEEPNGVGYLYFAFYKEA